MEWLQESSDLDFDLVDETQVITEGRVYKKFARVKKEKIYYPNGLFMMSMYINCMYFYSKQLLEHLILIEEFPNSRDCHDSTGQ